MYRTMTRAATRALPVVPALVALALAAPAAAWNTGTFLRTDLPSITDSTTGSTDTEPEYTGSDIAVGDALVGLTHDWANNNGMYIYQWYRCYDSQGDYCDAIAGATTTDYTTQTPDYGMKVQFCTTVPRGDTRCSPLTRIVMNKHVDTDADGTPDYQDACATTAGPDNGCPPAPVAPSDSKPDSSSSAQAPGPAATGSDRGAPNGTNATDQAAVTALIAKRTLTAKAAYGRKITVSGRLAAPDGRPIGGALLVVQAQPRIPGTAFADIATVRTASDGSYVYVAPAGPSRMLRIAYRAFANDSWYADSTDVELVIASALTLKATPTTVRNHKAAVFTGRVQGSPIPARGVLVDLQVWFHGKWRTFATPRTNSKGVFRFKYRFTQGAAKWRFRARNRADSTYPYELAYSRKLTVTVSH